MSTPPIPTLRLPSRKEAFTLVEMIGAIAILFVLLGSFYAALNAARKLQSHYRQETGAIVVLNNVLERVRAEAAPDPGLVSTILDDEWALSRLSEDPGLSADCTTSSNRLRVSIRRTGGREIAAMELRP